MKITEVRTWLVEGIKYNWTLVKVYTDSGLTGIGEATNWPGSPLIEAACRHVGEVVIGEDPSRIDYIWSRLYRDMNWLGQGGPLLSAISAIDIALWDIMGKRANMPVYELFGGAYRKRIQLYANYWFIQGDGSPESYALQARDMAALAETYNIPIAPHNPNGPVSTIASAHVMAATPNFFRQEFMLMDVPWRDTVIGKPLPVKDGFFHLSDAPGLGFDLVEEEMNARPGVRVARPGFYI